MPRYIYASYSLDLALHLRLAPCSAWIKALPGQAAIRVFLRVPAKWIILAVFAQQKTNSLSAPDADVLRSTTMTQTVNNDPFILAGTSYQSRLLVGTGKYKDFDETRQAIEASGAEIVTVAIRRTNIGQNANEPNLLDYLPPSKYTLLPNTAGCYTADDAVRTLRLARELLDGHKLVKLEVLGDSGNLFPNMPETLKAAKTLVDEGFDVMVYCADDPIQARMLEEMGCTCRDAGSTQEALELRRHRFWKLFLQGLIAGCWQMCWQHEESMILVVENM